MQNNTQVKRSLRPIIVFFIMGIMAATPAYAGGSPMTQVLCQIIGWFQGNLGAGLATIGISAVAIGAILGKVSWGLALTVAVGVSVMFGATDVLVESGLIDGGVC